MSEQRARSSTLGAQSSAGSGGSCSENCTVGAKRGNYAFSRAVHAGSWSSSRSRSAASACAEARHFADDGIHATEAGIRAVGVGVFRARSCAGTAVIHGTGKVV